MMLGMTRAYPLRLTPWQLVIACFLVVPLIGSAQQPKTNVISAPGRQRSEELSDRPTARQQWAMLRLADQFSRKAELLEIQGKVAEAEQMAQRALALQEQVRGPAHLEVARNVDRLADLYMAHKKESAAELLYERAQAIRDRILSTHPDVYDRDGSNLKIRRNQPAEKAGSVEPPH